jgi:class 3 adenylate cyclase
MQDELRRYSAKLVADGGTPVEARIGANTGEVVVRSIQTGGGHTEYTPIGHTANLASRMQAVAPTGSIAISPTSPVRGVEIMAFDTAGASSLLPWNHHLG